jgi:hypothetical protein
MQDLAPKGKVRGGIFCCGAFCWQRAAAVARNSEERHSTAYVIKQYKILFKYVARFGYSLTFGGDYDAKMPPFDVLEEPFREP